MLEAAALGVPLLASRAGGMADVLIDERHGFLFERGQQLRHRDQARVRS